MNHPHHRIRKGLLAATVVLAMGGLYGAAPVHAAPKNPVNCVVSIGVT